MGFMPTLPTQIRVCECACVRTWALVSQFAMESVSADLWAILCASATGSRSFQPGWRVRSPCLCVGVGVWEGGSVRM